MKKFVIIGHAGFYNRGCEAIIRCTVQMLRERFGRVKVSIYSVDSEHDRDAWRDPDIEFLPARMRRFTLPWLLSQTCRVPFLRQHGLISPLPSRGILNQADCVLSVGGDNYTLDYGIPNGLIASGEKVLRARKPLVIWGASIGPFDKKPGLLRHIRKHLQSVTLITARETTTIKYLYQIGVRSNVSWVADPAFILPTLPVDTRYFWPKHDCNGVMGICISPLLAKYLVNDNIKWLIKETAAFVERVIENYDISILLVPHVIGRSKVLDNNDFIFLSRVKKLLVKRCQDRIGLMPGYLNASETKFVISHCRFFVGSRMHSTIASMSSLVPTISISYSMKAIGINRDIFGHEKYVVDSRKLNTQALLNGVNKLIQDETIIRNILARRIPEMQALARSGVEKLAKLLKS